jgi:hypothetical protein
MIPENADRLLLWVAAAHLLLGLLCLLALFLEAEPILGVHPGLKPMKFGFSIAAFLGAMALLLPSLSVSPESRRGISLALASTMVVEMLPIFIQALRGTTSHFNMRSTLDTTIWQVMVGAIVIATLTMAGVALIATIRPLYTAHGQPLDPLLATAWRVALWLFLLAAFSGFSMGGRLQHSVGGEDGGPGLPLTNWSTTHGDLRVSHFVALHALQTIPLSAAVLVWLPLSGLMRWVLLSLVLGAHLIVALWTLLQAFAARPVW